jgi:hypothetical protein
MNSSLHRSSSRRDFLASSGRSVALLALAVFAGWQEMKRRRLANDPECLKVSVCSDCLEFGRCDRPKATEARRGAPRAEG